MATTSKRLLWERLDGCCCCFLCLGGMSALKIFDLIIDNLARVGTLVIVYMNQSEI